ncbi:MAG TPA: YvrJ family protein [Bacillota bacterium]|nr:YvrJ family protein [Bacillota bacterium]
MDTWLLLMSDVGFPVAVTFYLLYRIEGKLEKLTHSIHALTKRDRR